MALLGKIIVGGRAKALWGLLIGMILVVVAPAQMPSFTTYGINEGLPSEGITSIMQDKTGVMWFATQDSLARFDGKRFRYYLPSSKNYQKGDYVTSITCDSTGGVWVGMSSGVFRLDANKEKLVPFLDTLKYIRKVYIDHENDLWIACWYELYRYSFKTGKLTQFLPSINSMLIDLVEINRQIYLGTQFGDFYHIDIATGKIRHKNIFPKAEYRGASELSCLYQGGDTAIYMATYGKGLLKMNPSTFAIDTVDGLSQSLRNYAIEGLTIDNRGQFWLGTQTGLFIYDAKTHQKRFIKKVYGNPYQLSDDWYTAFYKDKEGGVWVGTSSGGVGYYNRAGAARFNKYIAVEGEGELTSNLINRLREDDLGQVWICTDDTKFNILSPQTGYVRQLVLNGEAQKLGVLLNPIDVAVTKREIYCLTNLSLVILDRQTKKTLKWMNLSKKGDGWEPQSVNGIKILSNGRVLLLGLNDIIEYLPQSGTFKLFLSGKPIHMFPSEIVEGKKGHIWIASSGQGIFDYDYINNKLTAYPLKGENGTSRTNYLTYQVEIGKGDTLWVASGADGLNYLAPGKQSLTRFQIDSLQWPLVYAVLQARDGSLWCSSNKGLFCIASNRKDYKHYSMKDGLPTSEFMWQAALRSKTGQLYFGTQKGVVSLDPSDFQMEYDAPSIYITDLIVNRAQVLPSTRPDILSRPIEKTDTITLSYKDASAVEIGFASMSYASSASQTYAYQMEGVTDGWVYLKQNRNAFFTQLRPGTYIFRVKSKTVDHKETRERRLVVVVTPPLWRTNLAYALYVLLIGGIILGLVRIYNQRQEHKREQRSIQDKLSFFTQAAHEIKTPLTLIRGPLENITDQVDQYPDIQADLFLMNKHTDRLVALVNQLMDFRRFESKSVVLRSDKVNIAEELQAVLALYKDADKFKHVKVVYNQRGSAGEMITDKEVLGTLIGNLVSNAMKFAASRVEVDLKLWEGGFKLQVLNDGLLIQDKDKEKLFAPFVKLQESRQMRGSGIGLALSRSLSELLKMELYFGGVVRDMNLFVLEKKKKGGR